MGRKAKEPAWVSDYMADKARWERSQVWGERLAALAPKALEVLENALDEAKKLDPERQAKLAALALRLAMSAWPEREPSPEVYVLRAGLASGFDGDEG